MSTVEELFAPKFLGGGDLTPAVEQRMAAALGADSLRYLPVEAIARSVEKDRDHLCQACIDGRYPTSAGRRLYQIALDHADGGENAGSRTYEAFSLSATVRT
jgi:amidophosphoribosyltransferase